MQSIRFARNDYEFNCTGLRFNIVVWKAENFLWETSILIPRTFWTVSSLGSELSAQLEFQTLFRKLLSTLPAFLFRGLDAILGKLIDSAGLIPLLKIMCFRDFISNDTHKTRSALG